MTSFLPKLIRPKTPESSNKGAGGCRLTALSRIKQLTNWIDLESQRKKGHSRKKPEDSLGYRVCK